MHNEGQYISIIKTKEKHCNMQRCDVGQRAAHPLPPLPRTAREHNRRWRLGYMWAELRAHELTRHEYRVPYNNRQRAAHKESRKTGQSRIRMGFAEAPVRAIGARRTRRSGSSSVP